MNFNRNTSRIAVYGPRRLGGIGLTHGYARQGAESVCHLLTHIRWGGDLGTVMMSVLSQVQLLSGRGVSILEKPIQRPKRNANKKVHIYKWHHLGIGWFQSMSMFLHTINGSIILKNLWTPQPVRERDSILIDDFRNAIKLSEWEWAQVNSVRLWLRALTVADITDPSGRNIEAWARVGSRRLESNLSWPRQELKIVSR